MSEENTGNARLAMNPIASNASTARLFAVGTFGAADLVECFDVLKESTDAVNSGDLSGAEQMLVAQSVALNSMFGEFARRAALAEKISNMETYMRLALKAQAQSRATMQTLAEFKIPRQVAFVRQANIAQGHQQVNNGVAQSACGEDSILGKNELLHEVPYGERLDTGATIAAIDPHQELATVGEIDRTQDARGNGGFIKECREGRSLEGVARP